MAKKGNKKVMWIILVVVVLLLIGGGVYYGVSKKGNGAESFSPRASKWWDYFMCPWCDRPDIPRKSVKTSPVDYIGGDFDDPRHGGWYKPDK